MKLIITNTFDIPLHPGQPPGDVPDGVPLEDGACSVEQSSERLVVGQLQSNTWLCPKCNDRSSRPAVLALLPQVRGKGQVHPLQPQGCHNVGQVI